MIRILCNRLPTTSVSHTCLRYYLQNSTRVVTRQGFHRSSISMAEAAADQLLPENREGLEQPQRRSRLRRDRRGLQEADLDRRPAVTPEPLATFKIVELKGDLFDSPPTESLAHCVSEDLHMGKGIEVSFKKQFKGVSELKSQGKKVGDVAVLKKDDRYIYYLITKKQYNHKPSYRTLTMALEAMKKHCVENKVKNLSMPKIGCGLDRLDWGGVSNILDDVFKDTDITITVYTL